MMPSTDHDMAPANVSRFLQRAARAQPHRRAVVTPHGRDGGGRVSYVHLTFEQLDRESDRLARGLDRAGIGRGTRTIVMVRPSLAFFVLTFAVFKAGAVPVMVDPGMGLRRMLACFQECRPEAFIGIPVAHVLRKLRPGFFRSVKRWVTVGRRWFWGGFTLTGLMDSDDSPFAAIEPAPDETAAILFTTGSTGPAKGVVYTHSVFGAQIESIRSHYGITAGEIDLPTFPLFALFDPALGMTAVIPDMDPTRPARVDPRKIIEAITNQGVTNMFASPALLHRVGRYGRRHGIQLPSLKRVISAGAPIMPSNIEQFSSMLVGDAQVHTGYGATEAMPVASIAGGEILSETRPLTEQGRGVCVGRPLADIRVRILEISDAPIPDISSARILDDGSVGEITVQGPPVTRRYYQRPEADALAKIAEEKTVWHRMGDLGRIDAKGRIWFYGRKSHRVITSGGSLFTIPCEAIFNNHPSVYRSALVGVGKPPRQRPVICIEPYDKHIDREQLTGQLLEMAGRSELTRMIDTVLFPPEFPVDIRHNSKIFREKLAVWAAKKLQTGSKL
ncbi:MAG TPA: fatty acid CoA ligase family protein [Desulfobacterales bacterium]